MSGQLQYERRLRTMTQDDRRTLVRALSAIYRAFPRDMHSVCLREVKALPERLRGLVTEPPGRLT